VIEQRSLSTVALGLLLASAEQRLRIARCVEIGATPALVALLASDRNGSARMILPHGRTWPAVVAEPEAGHA
jgi:hypothetical protein